MIQLQPTAQLAGPCPSQEVGKTGTCCWRQRVCTTGVAGLCECTGKDWRGRACSPLGGLGLRSLGSGCLASWLFRGLWKAESRTLDWEALFPRDLYEAPSPLGERSLHCNKGNTEWKGGSSRGSGSEFRSQHPYPADHSCLKL